MKWRNLAECTMFFITATIAEWRPLLAEPPARDILPRDLEFYRVKYGCRILAYVIMPEHYHLIIDFQRPEDLHRWLHDLQLCTGNEIAKRPRDTALPEEPATYARHANGTSKLAVWKEQARALGIISDADNAGLRSTTHTTTLLSETWSMTRRCGPGRAGATTASVMTPCSIDRAYR